MKVKNISLSVIVILGQVLAPQQIGDAPDGHGGVQDLIDLGLLQVVADEVQIVSETETAQTEPETASTKPRRKAEQA